MSNHIQPDWFLGCKAWTVDVVKGINTFMVLLLAAMAFATNSIYTLDTKLILYRWWHGCHKLSFEINNGK